MTMNKPKLTIVSDEEPNADGRVRRSERSRQKIIDAVIILVEGGNMDPSAQEVASEANVGLRSVFRHFDDMDSLYSDVIAQKEQEIMPIIFAPYESSDWRAQLNERIDRRVMIYERFRHLLIFGRIRRYKSVVMNHDVNRASKLQRSQLKEVLPKDIAADKILFEALDVMTSFDAFRKLREMNGLSVKRITEVMKDAVWRLIGDQG